MIDSEAVAGGASDVQMPAAARVAPPVRVHGLRKSFAQGACRIEAVRGVDFEAPRGTITAIMGPSGSGKSTLLHLMGGLTGPDAGSVEIDGVDIAGMSDRDLTRFRRRRIGIVFQAYNLIPTLTAEQNILLPLALESGRSADEATLTALLEQLGLAQRRHHRPDALSGGEQQRVAIARALIADPAVVLADEPTGNLDTETTRSICRQLRGICHERGRTLILVTHEPAVAFHADFVCIMKDGVLGKPVSVSRFAGVEALALHYQESVFAEAAEVGA